MTIQNTNIFSLPSIQSVMLSNNQFSGSLPSHFKTTQLGVLLLDANALSGTIPIEFCALDALANVDISRNQITGTIPTQIGLLRSLHTIDAMHNRISGSLPNEMLQLNRNLRLNFTDNLYVQRKGDP
jgi:Leucine-rich repeat (LRR) protein